MTIPQRGQFGEERYEKEEFQRTVRATFLALMEEDKVCVCVYFLCISCVPHGSVLITLLHYSDERFAELFVSTTCCSPGPHG